MNASHKSLNPFSDKQFEHWNLKLQMWIKFPVSETNNCLTDFETKNVEYICFLLK